VEVKNPEGYGTCIMNYNLQYSRSGKEEYLEGTYLGKPEVKEGDNQPEWGDCGGGKVFLRKVAASNFYIEPFLRKKSVTPAPPTVNRNQTKPLTPPPVVRNNTRPNTQQNKITDKPVKDPVKKDNVAPPATRDSSFAQKDVKRTIPVPPPVSIPEALKTRQNELMKSLVVKEPNVTIKLYDNGEIDDDTISVYLDKKLVLSNKRLTTIPLVVKLKMDEDNPEHELVMVAENLGRIPPNTSLMIVESGQQRFDVRITSTEQKNAVVRFRYQPDK
jgi:hypothetical protein